MSAEPSALDGLRVLELGSFIAGPFAGQLLGDLGADVIKVEPPETGDPMRRWGVLDGGRSLWWPAIARNKRSVAVNLRDERGRDVVRRLAAHVDVVLENFKPGTLERWGLGYDALAAVNPAVVLVHVSGYGQTGPRAHEPGFGAIGEAVGGVRFTTGEPDRPPARTGISLGDSLAALFAVIGTLTALHERSRSGRGQEVDVAIAEAVFALMESTVADFELGGVTRTRNGGVLKGVAPSNAYPTSDDRDVVIAANADAVFARLCDAMDRPELATDARYAEHEARGAHQDGARRRDRAVERAALGRRPARAARAPLGAVRADPRRARSRDRSRTSRRARWCCGSRRASIGRCRWRASSRSSPARPVRCAPSVPRSASTPTSSCATSPASPTATSRPSAPPTSSPERAGVSRAEQWVRRGSWWARGT